MGLASLATIPVGFFCYGLMMKGSPQFYQRTVTATKALNDTAGGEKTPPHFLFVKQ